MCIAPSIYVYTIYTRIQWLSVCVLYFWYFLSDENAMLKFDAHVSFDDIVDATWHAHAFYFVSYQIKKRFSSGIFGIYELSLNWLFNTTNCNHQVSSIIHHTIQTTLRARGRWNQCQFSISTQQLKRLKQMKRQWNE